MFCAGDARHLPRGRIRIRSEGVRLARRPDRSRGACRESRRPRRWRETSRPAVGRRTRRRASAAEGARAPDVWGRPAQVFRRRTADCRTSRTGRSALWRRWRRASPGRTRTWSSRRGWSPRSEPAAAAPPVAAPPAAAAAAAAGRLRLRLRRCLRGLGAALAERIGQRLVVGGAPNRIVEGLERLIDQRGVPVIAAQIGMLAQVQHERPVRRADHLHGRIPLDVENPVVVAPVSHGVAPERCAPTAARPIKIIGRVAESLRISRAPVFEAATARDAARRDQKYPSRDSNRPATASMRNWSSRLISTRHAPTRSMSGGCRNRAFRRWRPDLSMSRAPSRP